MITVLSQKYISDWGDLTSYRESNCIATQRNESGDSKAGTRVCLSCCLSQLLIVSLSMMECCSEVCYASPVMIVCVVRVLATLRTGIH